MGKARAPSSRLTLIGAPFHLGVMGVGMGRGPAELLDTGALPDRLRGAGHEVEVAWIGDPGEEHEVGRIFELNRELAGLVRSARHAGRMPLIVAGNCNACLGAIGGIGAPRTGIVWLDAHPDLHTPETTESGFLDGMALAMATGACWSALAGSIPGFHAVEDENAILIGARDIDPAERERLDSGEVTAIEGGGGSGTLPLQDLERALAALAGRVEGVYLHVDLDVIDPDFGRANEYATGGGLSVDDAQAAISIVAERTPVLASSFTAYNPDADPDRRFGATALEVVAAAVEAVVTHQAPRSGSAGRGWSGRTRA